MNDENNTKSTSNINDNYVYECNLVTYGKYNVNNEYTLSFFCICVSIK
jgi:hypothetical protein